jgi:hypothetical protein
LEESVASLQRRGWWPGEERRIQERLWNAATDFFSRQEHMRIDFTDLTRSPEEEIARIAEYLGIDATGEQRADAALFVRRQRQAT